MMPPRVHSDDFLQHLLHPAITKSQLKRLFSEYQFVSNALGDEKCYTLPVPVTPASFQVSHFSIKELSVISAYDPNFKEMNDPKKGFNMDGAESAMP